MNLNNRVFEIEHRLYVFALPETPWDELEEGDIWEPNQTDWGDYEFSADSVWFVLQEGATANNEKVVGFSLYSITNGWSQTIPFDIDLSTFNASQINFSFNSGAISDKDSSWASIDDVGEALNKIATELGSFGGNLASTAVAGIVKIGNNINIDNTDGTISVPNASASTAGVVTVSQTIPTSNASSESVPSLSAVRSALGNLNLKTTYVNISSGNLNGGAATGQLYNGNQLYYSTYSIGVGFGDRPTVFLAPESGLQTTAHQRSFNCIRSATYDNATGELCLYSLNNSFPNSFTICVKS